MNNKVNLIYKLSGQGIEDGIDVFELSPILLSFGKLIKEAHKTIYPEHRELSINIKPFQKGSFEIDILVYAKSGFHQLIDIIKSPLTQDIKELLEWIGIIGGGLIYLITKMKGKVQKIEKIKPGEYRYISEEGIAITVDENVHKLYLNSEIREFIYSSIAKPLEIEGIEQIESYLKNQEEKTKKVYDKRIAEHIRRYYESPLPETDKTVTIENKRTLWVHPKRVSLEGERRWSFRIGGSEQVVIATIYDDVFLEKIKKGYIRLTQADRLLIDLTEKQTIKGNTPLLMTYEITKVLDYEESPIQGELDFKDNPAEDLEEE